MEILFTDDWSLGHTTVCGGEDICIGGQRLNIIFAPVDLFCVCFVLKTIIIRSNPSLIAICNAWNLFSS